MQVVSFAFNPSGQENQLASFSNIFAFCYCHKMQLGTLDCGTRSFAFLVAGKKKMAIHNGYLLHLVIPSAFRAARKMKVISFAFSRFRQENQLASFSNIFAFCYCHKMQLGNAECGTRSFAFLAAGKKQMTILNGYLLHLVIPSAFRAARKMQVVSFAFSRFKQETQLVSFSNIFAFCYCHKMQLGNADCGTRSFAFLAAGKKQMAIHNGYFCIWSFHLHLEPLAQCKWFLLRSVLSDRKTNWLPSVTYLHSATVTKRSWEMRIVGHGHLHFSLLAKRRWQFITAISCIWSFHLHLEPPAKCKWFLLPLAVSDGKTNWLPSVTYLHSATVTKCSWELWIVEHGHLHS